jgi:DNA repair exonuclease SbcCD ATPase subunit
MIKLKSLKFKNVGRFTTEQFIDFTGFSSLVQVDAINNNTGGGSSGSGKSTIFCILLWVMGLDTLPTTVLQSRLTDEHICGTVELDWDGKAVTIKRGRKLSVVIEGQAEVTGSSKLAEEELDKVYGLKRNLFKVLLLKAQGDQGFFLNMGPAKIFEFLTDCLNLGQIRSKIDLIDVKTKDLTTLKTESQSSLQASEAALDANKKALEAIGEEPATEVNEALVEGWKGQYEHNQSILKGLQEVQSQEKSELNKNRPELTSVPFDRTKLNLLEEEIKAIEKQIDFELNEEKSRQAEANKTITALKLETANKISVLKLEHNNKLSEFKAAVTNLSSMVNTGQKSKEAAIELAAKIKTQRDGICHTCTQPWITEKAKSEEQRLLSELTVHKENIEAASFASKEIESLKASLSLLSDVLDSTIGSLNSDTDAHVAALTEQAKPKDVYDKLIPLNAKLQDLCGAKLVEKTKESVHSTEQNSNNNKLMEAFLVKQKDLDTKYRMQLDKVTKQVEEARNQYERLNSELKNHETNLANYKKILKNLTDGRDEINRKLTESTQKLADTTEKLELAEEAKRCLKSYLSCSFDDALDSVSESATRILRAVPTMANATVRLIGTKETNSGAIKEQVVALLDNDGEIDINIKSLSGGERSALDLSIDLAVCEMIQERANKGIDIMILDEPFNGFDSTGIEHALEILKTFSVDKKILFVEHDSVAKEFVTSKITVIRDGETSTIRS